MMLRLCFLVLMVLLVIVLLILLVSVLMKLARPSKVVRPIFRNARKSLTKLVVCPVYFLVSDCFAAFGRLFVGVYMNIPIEITQSHFPSEDVDLRKAIECLGVTSFRQDGLYLDAYYKCSKRIALLEEIRDHYLVQLKEYHCFSDVMEASLRAPFDAGLIGTFLLQVSADLDYAREFGKQLDIYHLIDHPEDGVRQFLGWIADNPERDVRGYYNVHKESGLRDEVAQRLRKVGQASRRSYTMQLIQHALEEANRSGWYIVFDTLTLAEDRVKDFYDTPTALRNHFRNVGRRVLAAEGRSVKEGYADCFQYFSVPEYGGKHGRLHFHAVYLMRTLPAGCVDPNIGFAPCNRRQILGLSGLWEYGFSAPIAVRYQGDAFGRRGWLWPKVNGKAIESKPVLAVARYVCKYVCKKVDQDDVRYEFTSGSAWRCRLAEEMVDVPKTLFRVRMSRGFGQKVPSMEGLSTDALLQMTKLHSSVSHKNKVLSVNAKRELRSRMAMPSIASFLASRPPARNVLRSLRILTPNLNQCSLLSFIDLIAPKLTIMDISEEVYQYVRAGDFINPRLLGGVAGNSKSFGSK